MKPNLIIKSLEDLFGIVILIENIRDKDFLANLLESHNCRVGRGNGRGFKESRIKEYDRWVIHEKLDGETFGEPRVFTTDRIYDVSFHNLVFQIPDRQTDSSMIMSLF